jgi:hypothetical protein
MNNGGFGLFSCRETPGLMPGTMFHNQNFTRHSLYSLSVVCIILSQKIFSHFFRTLSAANLPVSIDIGTPAGL